MGATTLLSFNVLCPHRMQVNRPRNIAYLPFSDRLVSSRLVSSHYYYCNSVRNFLFLPRGILELRFTVCKCGSGPQSRVDTHTLTLAASRRHDFTLDTFIRMLPTHHYLQKKISLLSSSSPKTHLQHPIAPGANNGNLNSRVIPHHVHGDI